MYIAFKLKKDYFDANAGSVVFNATNTCKKGKHGVEGIGRKVDRIIKIKYVLNM